VATNIVLIDYTMNHRPIIWTHEYNVINMGPSRAAGSCCAARTRATVHVANNNNFDRAKVLCDPAFRKQVIEYAREVQDKVRRA
jgi:hypothetical protein